MNSFIKEISHEFLYQKSTWIKKLFLKDLSNIDINASGFHKGCKRFKMTLC